MFKYRIVEHKGQYEEVIGMTIGRKKAFDFINDILKREDLLGIWFGEKCVVNKSDYPREYTIEKVG